MAAPGHALDQTMAIQHGMDGASGGDPDIAGQAAHQQLPDLAGAPMGLVPLQADDRGFKLLRQLVGIAHRPPRSVAQGFQAMLLVALEDLVPRLAGDAELARSEEHTSELQSPFYL